MIDFDSIDDWAPSLAHALRDCVPADVGALLQTAQPRYVEDALDILFQHSDRDAIIDATLAWLGENTIAGYHGSRLSDNDLASIETHGLIPLDATTRRDRLARALAKHPRWNEVSSQLDEAIAKHGQGGFAGRRERQTHLTLSRAGLKDGFNHYLKYGAEFDQHVAHYLLGHDAYEILAQDGKPVLLTFAVPGEAALAAAHPHFTIENLHDRGDNPNIVGDFLQAWSYMLAHPTFQSRTLRVDCGMVFRTAIPADWIVGIEQCD